MKKTYEVSFKRRIDTSAVIYFLRSVYMGTYYNWNATLKSLRVYCAAVIYFQLRLQFIAVTRPMFRPPPLFHFSLH